MPPVWITPRSLPANTAPSANNSAPAAPAEPWPSSTSPSLMQSIPLRANTQSHTGIQSSPHPYSTAAAIAQAAHDTLSSLFPSQRAAFDQELAEDLLGIKAEPPKATGIALGRQIAAAVLASRVSDGSEVTEPHIGVDFFPSNLPGHWRQDPISQIPLALGAHWGKCKIFVIKSSTQFQAPPPPEMTSAAYTAAYDEAKNFGGDGVVTPTQRTPEQTFIGTVLGV